MANKVTVIGGSGFVGTNLCRQLALKQQDFEIIDLKRAINSRRSARLQMYVMLRLCGNPSLVMVVNLAAVHRDDVRDKAEYQRTNVNGAENVALICEEKGINKIVFTSTVAV